MTVYHCSLRSLCSYRGIQYTLIGIMYLLSVMTVHLDLCSYRGIQYTLIGIMYPYRGVHYPLIDIIYLLLEIIYDILEKVVYY